MPLTFTGYRSTETNATGANSNSIYASPFTINGGASTSTFTITDGGASDVLYGDGGGDAPTDATQTLSSTTAPTVDTGGFIFYEAVVTFSGDDGNTYTAIIFDYDEDGNGGIDNNNSDGLNDNNLYEEGFFIAFIPNGFNPASISNGDIAAGPIPPAGVELTRTAEVLNSAQFTITCFTRGTRIRTKHGDVPVENLNEGDLIETVPNKFEKLRMVVSRKISASEVSKNTQLRPVRIMAGALGLGLPQRDLVVSRQHRMVISSLIAERVCGTPDVLVAATKLTDLSGIFEDDSEDDIEYFHIIMDKHEVIYAEGAPTESMYIGPESIRAMNPEILEEMQTLFPELVDLDYEQEPALHIPNRKKQRELVARHLANDKPLLFT